MRFHDSHYFVTLGARTLYGFVLFFLMVAAAASARAADDDIRVSVTVEPTALSMSDNATLTVSVNRVQEVDSPILPPLTDAFDVLSQGSASNLQFINGQMSSQTTYTYLLSPKRGGTYVIAPIIVRVGGKEYRSQPITITVGGGSSGIPAPPSGTPYPYNAPLPSPSAPPPLPSGPAVGGHASEDLFITADVDNRTPFVNQQILYTFRFYTRVSIDQAVLKLPEFDNFFKEELVPEKKYYQTIGDSRYVVTEKVYALFPSKAEKLTIDPARLQLSIVNQNILNFFNAPSFNLRNALQNQNKTLASDPIVLTVSPLPEPEPDNFSNLVGTFSLSMSIDRQTLKAQESATVTFELSGRGNIGDAVLPTWPLPAVFKTYEDRPETKSEKTPAGIQGVKRFKRAIVPTQAGHYTLPALTLSYFNPETQHYETLSTQTVDLDVLQADGSTATPPPTAPTPPTAETPPASSAPTAAIAKPPAALLFKVSDVPRAVWIAMASVPPIVFLIVLIAFIWRNWRRAHAGDRRRSRALKTLRAALKPYTKKEAPISTDDLITVQNAVRHYFAAKSGRPHGAALAAGDIAQDLQQAIKVSTAQQTAVIRAIHTLESGLYGSTALSTAHFHQALAALIQTLEEIDGLL